MDQTMKDEIKALAVAATLENGTVVSANIMQLAQKIDKVLQRFDELKDAEVADPYLIMTVILPDEIGYEFLEATKLFKNSSVCQFIESKKISIDKDFTTKINKLSDSEDACLDGEKINLARVHLEMFAQKYQSLTKKILDAIK